jgi:hypothetical protein
MVIPGRQEGEFGVSVARFPESGDTRKNGYGKHRKTDIPNSGYREWVMRLQT